MFKKIALSGLLLSFLSLPLLAQQTATPDAPAQATTQMRKNRSMQHQMGDPTTRAQKMTDHLTKQLGLDQTTSQKVYDAALARAQKVDEIQDSSDNGRAKAQAMKANADEFKIKLQGILTPDQIAKLESTKGRMRKERSGFNGRQDHKEQN